jgi:hypothetical protein
VEGIYSNARTRSHGVWVPAFAGTTPMVRSRG